MNETERSIFSGMQILLLEQREWRWVKDHAVVVEGGAIKAIIPNDMIKHHLPAKHYDYHADHYLIPGLIDLHIHGARGRDVMDAEEEAYQVISKALAAEGVTGYLATTMTAPKEEIEKALGMIAHVMVRREGAAILGVHLEGPFIASTKRGAQHGSDMLPPDSTLLRHWQHIAAGAIKIVTFAPELPGAIAFVQTLRNMNIIPSIGHTDATYEEVYAAIHAGCSQATHLFNAMRGLHHREAGAAGALLLADNVNAEIIVDGLHLCPAMVDLILRVKGKERLLLVTDAMRGKCMNNGHFDLGGQRVEVRDGRAALPDGTLAGSTLRMPQAIKNMVQFTKCSMPDAISMASHNPALILGMDVRKGSISVGKDADLVVLDAQFDPVLTMVEGNEVFRK